VTLHDVQELHFPENFTPEERAYRAITYLELLRKADRVIVSYDHIKRDIIKYFKVDSKKIQVLLLNMKNLWIDKFHDKDMVDIKHLGLPERFLLYPANTWQHKNHLRLMSALAEAKEKYRIIINIVCTGHRNEHFNEIERLVTQLDIAEQVFFTGVVEENVLYSLYKSCTGVIIPTTYEAGSFPLYESILMNVPVICSNVTSLPETIGNKDYVFDPFKTDEISNLMIKLWQDEDFRERNIKHVKESSQQFQNNDSALEQVLNVYSEVIEN
jgi:glycosyltransferase involved in cell wall biosynthesis